MYFPENVTVSDSLFDATITDGDCKIRVSLDPSLNRLISKNVLHCGSLVRNVVFSTGNENAGESRTFQVCGLDVDRQPGSDATLRALSGVNVRSLPWMGGEPSLLPLRARRSTYVPLWNNHDFTGSMWLDTPPSASNEELDSDEDVDDNQPTVLLGELRRRFLAGHRRPRGALCVRVLQKSRLIYYGKSDQICECPYKAELLVGDGSLTVCVVLWNSLCLDWYRCLHPGQVLRLNRYRVKQSYMNQSAQGPEPCIEISLNSRNPTAKITVIPKNRVSPDWSLPDLPHTFLNGQKLLSCPHGNICDVIGTVMFVGRQERVRNKDGQNRTELNEYRWLQLEDGTSDQPIMIKLYPTSQPDIQSRIQPMTLLVCTRLQLIRITVGTATSFQYLTNTPHTQVYCTGTGSPSVMPYRGLRPIRQFLHWLKRADENSMLNRAVVGGYFTYPPLPASLQRFLDNTRVDTGLISGGELRVQCEKLHYRETKRFTIQCMVISACYHNREDGRRRQSSSTPTSAQLSPRIPRHRDSLESPRPAKRKLTFSSSSPRKRLAPPLQQSRSEEDAENEFSLFDGAMEFLLGEDEDEEDDDDDNGESFFTPPSSPAPSHLGLPRIAMETVPRSFCYARRHVQALTVGMQTDSFHKLLPQQELESFSPAPCYSGHYTLTLRALTDGVLLDVLFLPFAPGSQHWKPLPSSHPNTWESILSHGGFSAEAPPPSPADLIAMATQLTSQRLVCVLEACALGGDRVELILSRAYPLRS